MIEHLTSRQISNSSEPVERSSCPTTQSAVHPILITLTEKITELQIPIDIDLFQSILLDNSYTVLTCTMYTMKKKGKR